MYRSRICYSFRPNLQQCCEHDLHALHICKSLHEFRSRVTKTVHAFTKEEVRCHIDCHAIKEILDIEGLPGCWELVYHGGCPSLKDVQITDAILDKHRPNEIPAFVPFLVVSCED